MTNIYSSEKFLYLSFSESRPSSSSSRVHPCPLHSEFEGLPGPYGDILFCPAHCEESFPPKYEDALKMAVCTNARNNLASSISQSTTGTLDTQNTLGALRSQRPSISSPPPIYSENTNEVNQRNSEGELPPSYTNTSGEFPSSNIFQPILRVTSAFRNSETASIDEPNSKVKNAARVSIGEIEPHIDRSSASHSRRSSLRPPRVPLPGAVETDEESENSQSEAIQRN